MLTLDTAFIESRFDPTAADSTMNFVFIIIGFRVAMFSIIFTIDEFLYTGNQSLLMNGTRSHLIVDVRPLIPRTAGTELTC